MKAEVEVYPNQVDWYLSHTSVKRLGESGCLVPVCSLTTLLSCVLAKRVGELILTYFMLSSPLVSLLFGVLLYPTYLYQGREYMETSVHIP